eukprot:TRINITY_DN1893_c0_g2_i1.p1 TRINITY_DN1893_c0_g2~~TRINITY_DN1893_c0_g2_i1.p1  ORF type:complete len:626 (+),score=209.59 TRINITY_DN1893_c0_g2_i1:114-1991(+)
MQQTRIREPYSPDDVALWKQITEEKPALGMFPQSELQGWALKLSNTVLSPWDKRWFIFVGNFICYFPGQDPGSKCAGCYYIPGMHVERLADISNHPSAPVHFNAKKENCILFRPIVPRKPGGEYKDLILSLPDSGTMQRWEACVINKAQSAPRPAVQQLPSNATLAGSLGSSVRSERPGARTASPPNASDLLGSSVKSPNSPIPTTPNTLASSVRSGRGYSSSMASVGLPEPTGRKKEPRASMAKAQPGAKTKGKLVIPAHYQQMLKFSGITQDEADQNSETVMSVLAFAERQQQLEQSVCGADTSALLVKMEFTSTASKSAPPPPPPGANIPEKATYSLEELLTPEDPTLLYTNMVKLDSGSQGEVYKARRVSDQADVAVKKIFLKKPEKELPALENEISSLHTCRHKNIVNFHAVHRVDTTLYIVMELMCGGKLTDIIQGCQDGFKEEELAYLMKNICEGMAYLHSLGRIHRDIKSDNILLNSRGDVKLGDFGFCAALSEGDNNKRQTVVGTPYWMAPEVIHGTPYDYKADVWSMGILALEIMDGEPPYMRMMPPRALYVIASQTEPPKSKNPERWSSDCQHFVEKMLKIDPADRADAFEMLKHPFLMRADKVTGDFIGRMML